MQVVVTGCPGVTDETDSLPQESWSDRSTFLNLAGAVEGGLVLAALALAWLFHIDLWADLHWNRDVLFHSLAALVPLLAFFLVTYRWPMGPLGRIKEILLQVMGPPLAACRWYDLILLAGLAGLGEELLFRGVIQTGLSRWVGAWGGLGLASAVFGLVHAVTPTYAVLVGLIGFYLGGLYIAAEPPNLVTPILVHGVYDLAAFFVLRRDYRRRHPPARSCDDAVADRES
jgi:uncharacterized protein